MQFCGVLPQDKTPGIKLLENLWARYKSVDKFETSYWEGVVVAMIDGKILPSGFWIVWED